jgi:hypothetical protein
LTTFFQERGLELGLFDFKISLNKKLLAESIKIISICGLILNWLLFNLDLLQVDRIDLVDLSQKKKNQIVPTCVRFSSFGKDNTIYNNMNMQRCRLIEPLRSDNGVSPRVPTIFNGALSFPSPVPKVQDMPARYDTRLRIFSGTANCALSQVNFTIRSEVFL